MVFAHFNHRHGLLPSPEQILHGIVLAQIDQFDQATRTNMQLVGGFYIKVWKRIFEMVEDVDMRRPLTPKILSDPSNKFVRTLIYIYTMETFIYKELNKASRTKDVDKIKFYGAFASALSFVIHHGNMTKD